MGTGNGRFALELADLGFKNVTGIDLSEKLLAVAKKRATEKGYYFVNFQQMDACQLRFKDNSFSAVLMLQQLISLIDNAEKRLAAMQECYRVLMPGGLVALSCMYYPGRRLNPLISALTLTIKLFKCDRNYLHWQYLPWIKLGGKLNFNYLYQNQSYVYWFMLQEIILLALNTGFEILELKTSSMIAEKIRDFKDGTIIFLVCRKKL
jgi:ubiquinone/menaquinone biosynthesis C-methylase UbiE